MFYCLQLTVREGTVNKGKGQRVSTPDTMEKGLTVHLTKAEG